MGAAKPRAASFACRVRAHPTTCSQSVETALKRQSPLCLLLSATSRLLASVTSSGMSEVPSSSLQLGFDCRPLIKRENYSRFLENKLFAWSISSFNR